MKKLICSYCNKQIKNKSEVVTMGGDIYHEKCRDYIACRIFRALRESDEKEKAEK